jgi:pantoate--beta-alanine ligase
MSKQPQLVTSCQQVQKMILQLRTTQQRIGLVPTMGALHDGHLSLVSAAHAQCDFVVVTIFVNPAQFGPGEDLEQYPRLLENDLAQLAELDVDLVFAPSEKEIYPAGFSSRVEPPATAQPWEGAHRPHHFSGVVTVVSKLFNIIPADVAFFGQKDYQQAMVIQQLVSDLNFPIEIEICPIVRNQDGLALSSRNQYLEPHQRRQATVLSRCLQWAQQRVSEAERSTHNLTQGIQEQLREAGIEDIDYVAIVNPATLVTVEHVDEPAMLLLAAHVGNVRLIDNCRLVPG